MPFVKNIQNSCFCQFSNSISDERSQWRMFLHVHRFGEKQKWSFPHCLYLKETHDNYEVTDNCWLCYNPNKYELYLAVILLVGINWFLKNQSHLVIFQYILQPIFKCTKGVKTIHIVSVESSINRILICSLKFLGHYPCTWWSN